MASVPRLYINDRMDTGQPVPLSQNHAKYLFAVMRLRVGDKLEIFNGRDGAWQAVVVEASKRNGVLMCQRQSKAQSMPPDMWLLFAPLKKARTDFIVEKATEMGAARILPVQTEFTNAERIRQDRLQAHAIEAAEQCGGTFVPKVEALQKLSAALQYWPQGRQIIFCDETAVGQSVAMPDIKAPCALLIGPEGGFSAAERALLLARDDSHALSLGPRILRADTAAVAALTLWQYSCGDWS